LVAFFNYLLLFQLSFLQSITHGIAPDDVNLFESSTNILAMINGVGGSSFALLILPPRVKSWSGALVLH
jgi:hypothetical protein